MERERNYDDYFEGLEENSSFTDHRAGRKAEKTASSMARQRVGLSSTKKSDEEHACESLSTVDYFAMIDKMLTTINYLNEQVNSLGEEVRQMKKQPSLLIDDGETKDDDLPHLSKVEAFNLPIAERQHLEQLENMLEADKSFYVFFVCIKAQIIFYQEIDYNLNFYLKVNRLVPIVQNLFQNKRNILWGFTLSLMSKELLVKYTWSGRSQTNSKYGFERMKQIQGVLWCAMVKVSPLYSTEEFEEDFKANLVKCTLLAKEKNDITSIQGAVERKDESEAEIQI